MKVRVLLLASFQFWSKCKVVKFIACINKLSFWQKSIKQHFVISSSNNQLTTKPAFSQVYFLVLFSFYPTLFLNTLYTCNYGAIFNGVLVFFSQRQKSSKAHPLWLWNKYTLKEAIFPLRFQNDLRRQTLHVNDRWSFLRFVGTNSQSNAQSDF